MTRKFHPSAYSGAKEVLDAQVRADATVGAKKEEGIPLILKVAIGFGLINGLIFLLGDKDDLRGAFGRSR